MGFRDLNIKVTISVAELPAGLSKLHPPDAIIVLGAVIVPATAPVKMLAAIS